MSRGIYGNVALFLLCALAGSAMVICASVALDRLPLKIRFLRYLGRNTMPVLVVHRFVLIYLKKLARRLKFSRKLLAVCLCITAIDVAVCLAAGAIIRRALPELVGGRRKER